MEFRISSRRAALVLALLAQAVVTAQPAPPAGTISGYVIDSATGNPIRKAIVSLRHSGFALNAETDPKGYFTFTGLPPGDYRLSIRHPGFQEQHSRQPLRLAADAQMTHPPFRLIPFAVISGRVLDEDGEPAHDAVVSLYRYSYWPGRGRWELFRRESVNQLGEYRFTGLSPGRFAVGAESVRPAPDNHYQPGGPTLRPYLPAFYQNAFRLDDALPVIVDRGQEVRGIELQLIRGTLPPAVPVRGRATLPGATTTTRISISLVRDPRETGPRVSASAVADYPDFAFELRVPPGRYRLMANVYSGAPDAFAAEEIEIAGPIDGLVAPLLPAPRISVQATLLDGGSVDFARVRAQLYDLDLNSSTDLRADSTGRLSGLRDRLNPGAYALEVEPESLPEGLYFQSLRFNGQEVSPDWFDLRRPGQLEMILSRNAASISGIAVSKEQVPLPEAHIVLVPIDPTGHPRRRHSDAAGRFAFTNLPPGKYQLLVWGHPDSDLWRDPVLRPKYQPQATTVKLAPGASLAVTLVDSLD